MKVNTVSELIPLTNGSKAVALNQRAGRVVRARYWNAAAADVAHTMTALTVVTAAPADATQVQFTGTPSAPSAALALGANAAAGDLLHVTYEVEGAGPAVA